MVAAMTQKVAMDVARRLVRAVNGSLLQLFLQLFFQSRRVINGSEGAAVE
jgi:hypothetical protein